MLDVIASVTLLAALTRSAGAYRSHDIPSLCYNSQSGRQCSVRRLPSLVKSSVGRAPHTEQSGIAATSNNNFDDSDLALFAGFTVCIVAIVVDAGRSPVDVEVEPELVNFQSEDADAVEALAYTLLRGYKRAISPNLPKNCRFLPTCSEYAALSIKEFGIARGALLSAWRIARCNPVGGRGYDPPIWPPPRFNLGR